MGEDFIEIKCRVYGFNINHGDSVAQFCFTIEKMKLGFIECGVENKEV